MAPAAQRADAPTGSPGRTGSGHKRRAPLPSPGPGRKPLPPPSASAAPLDRRRSDDSTPAGPDDSPESHAAPAQEGPGERRFDSYRPPWEESDPVLVELGHPCSVLVDRP